MGLAVLYGWRVQGSVRLQRGDRHWREDTGMYGDAEAMLYDNGLGEHQ